MKYLKIFTDFLDVMEPLSDGAAGRLFRAMLRYALDGTELPLKGKEGVLWTVARQHIDREQEAYADMVEARREAGRRGADARWQKMAKHSKNSQDKDKEKEKDKEKDKDKDIFSSGAVRLTAAKKEIPPTLEEVMTFSQETGLDADAHLFFDYYEANGWYIGKQPIRNWKAALRAWARKKPSQPGRTQEPGSRETFLALMERARIEEAKQV